MSLPLSAIRRPSNSPVWALEAGLRRRFCATPRYRPPVRLIKLTAKREITPYPLDHLGDER
ncbi:hypothetical protein [Rhodopseudomonas palustris]|uniref:hypothetical protein n=1 Tax=Rhodopseudomonas palustris TaxID=1076 RepID=UPI0018DCFD47